MLQRRKALVACVGLQPGKPLERKRGLAQVGRKRREKAEAQGRPVKPALSSRFRPVPADLRAVLAERSDGGWCEMALSGCLGRGTEVSHRISYKAGGRKGSAAERHDRPSNALWSCSECHSWCHHRPTEAYDLGLMLKEHHNPLLEPVVRRGELVYLGDDGSIRNFEEVGA